MLRTRIIPCLLLRDEALVKTIKFGKFQYIGDPANTCRIFNELEVDELTFLDILASREQREPNYTLLQEIADQCFMPVSYGGGISSVYIAEKILKLGFEKVILNTSALNSPTLITSIAKNFGTQSVIIAIDVKYNFWGKPQCQSLSGKVNSKKDPLSWAIEVEELGAGEILLTDIDREGTWSGLNIQLIKTIAEAVNIPVIAHGGANSIEDIAHAVNEGKASAVALGSMVVFPKKGMGVLVNFPDSNTLRSVIQ